jgi:hypothetical protein
MLDYIYGRDKESIKLPVQCIKAHSPLNVDRVKGCTVCFFRLVVVGPSAKINSLVLDIKQKWWFGG